jgi:prolyl oligopeptidase
LKRAQRNRGIPEFGTVTTGLDSNRCWRWVPIRRSRWLKYPAVLLVTGINDPASMRGSGKLTARLQAASVSGKPILLRIDYDAGARLRLDEKQNYEQRADEFTFLLWQASIEEFHPVGTKYRQRSF